MSHTPGPITVDEVCGGFKLSAESVGHGHFGTIGCATQRDPHPEHGGGIDAATTRANAVLWAASGELLAACRAARDALTECREKHLYVVDSEAAKVLATLDTAISAAEVQS